MAIEFEFYETPDPSGEGETRYHARNVTRRNVSTEELCEKIQMGSSLTGGDVVAALKALSDQLIFNLQDGARVHLEGIGYFQATLKTTREVVPGKTRAQSVWFKSVKFRADDTLRKGLVGSMTVRSEFKIHSKRLTDRQVDRIVEKFFTENTLLTRVMLQELCGFTRYIADKHIKRLVSEGKIKNLSKPRRHPMYVKSHDPE